jgi:hypothetical protein
MEMASYQKERDQFIAVMSKEGVPLEIVYILLRLEMKMGRMSEVLSERDWTDEEIEKDKKYVKRATKLLEPYGITPIFGSDPRGPAIKLKLKSGRTNDFGNTGYCVPSR